MIGTTLSHFKITAKLGEGGMGEVYLAEDTKLGREVAIKVLPDAVADDPERLARFQREAKVLASLNHPNIAGIHSLEAAGPRAGRQDDEVGAGSLQAVNFLVMELASGEDLSNSIAAGPIPLERALFIARQIAEALEGAHEKGIVHRDLKPANVKVTAQGEVKVLDFGLAKALDPATGSPESQNLSLSPTLTAQMTQAGVLLGTAAYMSPEQARGQEADKRADIWAFGVVLMEMLSGSTVYCGDTVSDTLAGILAREPEWEALPEDTPVSVRQLVERCLEKDATQRLRDVGEARIAIDRYLADPRSDELSAGIDTAAPPASKNVLTWLAAALAVALVASLWFGLGRKAEPEAAEVTRFSVVPPMGSSFFQQALTSLDISRDGRRIVFVARNDNGDRHLYLKDLAEPGIRQMAYTENGRGPFFSPDGEWVAFYTSNDLRSVRVDGGSPQILTEIINSRGADWSEDGTVIFTDSTASGLRTIPERGGEVEVLTTLDEDRGERTHRFPHVLPGGKAVLFTSDTFETTEYYDDARIEVVTVEDGQRKVLLEGTSHARYVPPGFLLYARGGSVFSVPFDKDTLEILGDPSLVLQSVSTDIASGAVQFSTSDNGTLIFVPGDLSRVNRGLAWVDLTGGIEEIGIEPGAHFAVSLSPDGSRAAVVSGMSRTHDLWIADLERTTMSRLTFEGETTLGAWTRDGSRVAFGSSRERTHSRSFWKPADGSGEAELLLDSGFPSFPNSFSPEDKFLALHDLKPDRGSDVVVVPVGGDGELIAFAATRFIEWQPDFSPDGEWLVYCSDESGGNYEIYVRAFPGPGGKWQISREGGVDPRWSRTGDAIYYREGSTLLRVPIDTSSGFQIGIAERISNELLPRQEGNAYDVAADGRVIIVSSPLDETTREEIAVVVNWASELAPDNP